MPEPITQTSPLPTFDADPDAAAVPQALPPSVSSRSAGTDQLLAGTSHDLHGRMASTPLELGYFDAGVEGGAAHVDAAYLFGSQHGAELAVGLASAQVGEQTEAHLTLFSMSAASEGGATTLAVEDLSLSVGGGVHNPDGSTGLNLEADATLLSVELGHEFGEGDRVAVGLSFGPGVAGSAGTSNIDGDDYEEYCLRASAFGVTLGGCVELGRVADATSEWLQSE